MLHLPLFRVAARSLWRASRLALTFGFASAATTFAPAVLAPHAAEASTAVMLTLEDLVDKSEAVVVGIPKSKLSRWESGRIVTYTTVAIDTAVAGNAKAGESVVVRTYGGVVDGIGQITHGEAVLPLDKPIVLFVKRVPDVKPDVKTPTSYVVGMSQGALPVEIGADKVARIVARPTDLVLVPPKAAPAAKPAVVALAGKPVSAAVTDIRTVWAARAKK